MNDYRITDHSNSQKNNEDLNAYSGHSLDYRLHPSESRVPELSPSDDDDILSDSDSLLNSPGSENRKSKVSCKSSDDGQDCIDSTDKNDKLTGNIKQRHAFSINFSVTCYFPIFYLPMFFFFVVRYLSLIFYLFY